MSRYLAATLGLCALTTPSIAAAVSPAQPLQLSQETPAPVAPPSSSPQDSPQNSPPANPPAEPAQTGAEPSSGRQPEAKQPESAVPPAKPKTTSKKRRHRKTGAGTHTTPAKKVVRNGSTADPAVQLTPGMSKEQASSQRQGIAQLLAATDNNLKQISNRQLNSTQQDSVSQIRKYMEQAKTAEQAEDVERAHNLASKALLLSDDLVKH